MAVKVESVHIQLTLSCTDCGHEWDVDDYDTCGIQMAEETAPDENPCPKCEETDEHSQENA